MGESKTEQNVIYQHSGSGSEEDEPKFLCMVKSLIPSKLIYLFHGMSDNSLSSFINIFYIASGLSVDQFGLMNGIGIILLMIATPLWGILIDCCAKFRILLLVSLTLATSVSEFCKPWVITWVSKTQAINTCANVTSGNITSSDLNHNCTFSNHLLNGEAVFHIAAIHWILSSILVGGVRCYVQGAVVKSLLSRKIRYSYGEQMSLFPIGGAMGALLAGIAIDRYKTKQIPSFMAATYIYLPLQLLTIPLLYVVTKQGKWDHTVKKEEERNDGICKQVLTSINKPEHLVFLISVFIVGLARSVGRLYLFLYVQQTLDATKTFTALLAVATTISITICFAFSSKLIKIFGGYNRCIIIDLASISVFLLSVTFCKRPWHLLSLVILEGLPRALVWTSMVEKTIEIFPKEISTTAMGLLISLFDAAPNIVGHVLGGYLYHKFGGIKVFRGMSIIAAVWFVCMLIYFDVNKKLSKPPHTDSATFQGGIDNIDAASGEETI